MRAPAEPNATEASAASRRIPQLPHIYFDIFYDSLFGGFGFPATQMKLAARYLFLLIYFLCAPPPPPPLIFCPLLGKM